MRGILAFRGVLDHPPTLGALCGVTSAALFGLSAPCAKILLPGSQPPVLAGLLYAGAAITLSLARVARRRATNAEPRLRRSDLPLLLVITLTGGVLFGEHMSARGLRAAALIVGGGLAVAWSAGGLAGDLLGVIKVACSGADLPTPSSRRRRSPPS